MATRPSRRRKLIPAGLLLLAAAAFAVILPGARAHQTQAAPPASAAQAAPAIAPEFQFEVASIKPSKNADLKRSSLGPVPDGFKADSATVKFLIMYAYGVPGDKWLSGGPGWLSSDRYDVDAKMAPSIADKLQKMDHDQAKLVREVMVERLLADRFGLKIHRETKELPVYALEVAASGPKLKPTALPPPGSPGAPPPTTAPPRSGPDGKVQLPKGYRGTMMAMNGGQITMAASATRISLLAYMLTGALQRPVIDKTGLTGAYDFTLEWTSEAPTPMPDGAATTSASPTPAPPPGPAPDSGPTIFKALQEQLGLKLESTKGPVEIIVIDQISRPTPN